MNVRPARRPSSTLASLRSLAYTHVVACPTPWRPDVESQWLSLPPVAATWTPRSSHPSQYADGGIVVGRRRERRLVQARDVPHLDRVGRHVVPVPPVELAKQRGMVDLEHAAVGAERIGECRAVRRRCIAGVVDVIGTERLGVPVEGRLVPADRETSAAPKPGSDCERTSLWSVTARKSRPRACREFELLADRQPGGVRLVESGVVVSGPAVRVVRVRRVHVEVTGEPLPRWCARRARGIRRRRWGGGGKGNERQRDGDQHQNDAAPQHPHRHWSSTPAPFDLLAAFVQARPLPSSPETGRMSHDGSRPISTATSDDFSEREPSYACIPPAPKESRVHTPGNLVP